MIHLTREQAEFVMHLLRGRAELAGENLAIEGVKDKPFFVSVGEYTETADEIERQLSACSDTQLEVPILSIASHGTMQRQMDQWLAAHGKGKLE